MAENNTAIQWTHQPGFKGETWNPIIAIHKETGNRGWHCEHASRGCDHCYAEAQNRAGIRMGTKESYTRAARDRVDILLHEPTLLKPLSWKAPRCIFVCSMTDLFGEWGSDEWLDKIFAVMALCPQHRWMVLTKQSKRMREYLSHPDRFQRVLRAMFRLTERHPSAKRVYEAFWAEGCEETPVRYWPFPHLWLGVTAEDQKNADARIPDLLATPAALRWVSYEPAIGPLRLSDWLDWDRSNPCGCGDGECSTCWQSPSSPVIDLVVVGGESGVGARSFDINWARSVVRQCGEASVACFIKQLGKKPFDSHTGQLLKDLGSHGALYDAWPDDLKVRQIPEANRG